VCKRAGEKFYEFEFEREQGMSERREEKREDGHFTEQHREDERGDAAEPDAPLTAERNEGMSTILSGGLGNGVQDNLGE
jgi:hypothetical protein